MPPNPIFPGPFFVGAMIDAGRGEGFAALYRDGQVVDGPSAEKPDAVLARWATLAPAGDIVFVGDGAPAGAEVPALAPAIAQLAFEAAGRNEAVQPDVIRPIYVRRPDVELTRDRRAAAASQPR